MGIENMSLDEQAERITTPGQAGYRGAWEGNSEKTTHPSPETIRDSAIEGAAVEELEDAVSRMERNESPDADTLAALARVRARLDQLIQRNQH